MDSMDAMEPMEPMADFDALVDEDMEDQDLLLNAVEA
jgi:hypothetical protein